jgi:hypothetical protein
VRVGETGHLPRRRVCVPLQHRELSWMEILQPQGNACLRRSLWSECEKTWSPRRVRRRITRRRKKKQQEKIKRRRRRRRTRRRRYLSPIGPRELPLADVRTTGQGPQASLHQLQQCARKERRPRENCRSLPLPLPLLLLLLLLQPLLPRRRRKRTQKLPLQRIQLHSSAEQQSLLRPSSRLRVYQPTWPSCCWC